MFSKTPVSRRKFILGSGLGSFGALNYSWLSRIQAYANFPDSSHLGRICWGPTDIKESPSAESKTVKVIFEDEVITCLREVVGEALPYRRSRRWIQTPDGYVWSPVVQPVKNSPNKDTEKWVRERGDQGFWAEVTVPYTDARLINAQPVSYWLRYRIEHGLPPRFYYSQVLWIEGYDLSESGEMIVRVNERYGNPGDQFWAPANAFRPITDDEISPIHPEAEGKRVVVDLSTQTLSCFEDDHEVYFCRISSGLNPYGIERSKYLTPLGNFPVWGKYISLHMAGGTAVAGWDLPGVAWTSLFFKNGQAIHSTYWHNNFGEEMSNGCVNASPADAKWIFRWCLPPVGYEVGNVTVQGYQGTTMISVVEA